MEWMNRLRLTTPLQELSDVLASESILTEVLEAPRGKTSPTRFDVTKPLTYNEKVVFRHTPLFHILKYLIKLARAGKNYILPEHETLLGAVYSVTSNETIAVLRAAVIISLHPTLHPEFFWPALLDNVESVEAFTDSDIVALGLKHDTKNPERSELFEEWISEHSLWHCMLIMTWGDNDQEALIVGYCEEFIQIDPCAMLASGKRYRGYMLERIFRERTRSNSKVKFSLVKLLVDSMTTYNIPFIVWEQEQVGDVRESFLAHYFVGSSLHTLLDNWNVDDEKYSEELSILNIKYDEKSTALSAFTYIYNAMSDDERRAEILYRRPERRRTVHEHAIHTFNRLSRVWRSPMPNLLSIIDMTASNIIYAKSASAGDN